jgi:sugar diacid utilization regulator
MLSSVTGYTLLSYSPELLYRSSDYQSFLYNLLIGTPLENLPETYRTMKFQENMKLLYFRPENSEKPPIKGRQLREAFHIELPDCHVITYRKATIVVCSTVDTEKVDHLLDLFPSNYNVSVGISNSFHRIELLRDALSEARDALSIGKSIEPGRRVFPFEELGISIMLRHFSEKEDISRYIHPALHWLKQYDDEYNTKLLPTVREYIQQNGSIKKTAEALFLHRNSVIYRLRKAEEIIDLSLDDSDTQFTLRMSFCILKMLG